MPWRGQSASTCQSCSRDVSECGKLSARYKCAECGNRAMLEEKAQLRAFRGPYYDHWRARMAATIAVLPVAQPVSKA